MRGQENAQQVPFSFPIFYSSFLSKQEHYDRVASLKAWNRNAYVAVLTRHTAGVEDSGWVQNEVRARFFSRWRDANARPCEITDDLHWRRLQTVHSPSGISFSRHYAASPQLVPDQVWLAHTSAARGARACARTTPTPLLGRRCRRHGPTVHFDGLCGQRGARSDHAPVSRPGRTMSPATPPSPLTVRMPCSSPPPPPPPSCSRPMLSKRKPPRVELRLHLGRLRLQELLHPRSS